jgi:WD40 repeat protein
MTTTPKDRKPVDDHAVPLAVDPKGRSAVITGPIDRAKKKNVLWAYVAGDYDKDSPGNRILEGHKATVTSAAWSQDGQAVVTGDIDGVVIVRDAETMKEKNRAEFKGRVVAVAVNRDGTRAAAAVVAANPREESEVPTYREKVFVWDPRESPKDPKPLRVEAEKPLRDPFKGTGSLAFSPDGKMLAAAFCNKDLQSTSGELVGKVRIWELATPAKP